MFFNVFRKFFGGVLLLSMLAGWKGIVIGFQQNPNKLYGVGVFGAMLFILFLCFADFSFGKEENSTRISLDMNDTRIRVEGHKEFPKELIPEIEGLVNDRSWLGEDEYFYKIVLEILGNKIVDVERWFLTSDDFDETGFITGQAEIK